MVELPWLVVGLGNPGPDYAGNRHNAGAMVVNVLAARAAGRFTSHRARAAILDTRLAGPGSPRVVLAKPASYMNESGGPTAGLMAYFGVPREQLVVAHDELDLDFGDLRIKQGGGDNGHNGLRSITKAVGSNDYFRLRVGIGRPPGRMDTASFVLRDFTTAERRDLELHLQRAADAVATLITSGPTQAQVALRTDEWPKQGS